MKDLKLKVWDKDEQEWIELGGNIILSYDDEGFKCFDTDGKNYSDEYENIEIVQYTGLKDKNGKEICEGDILECHGFWDIRIEFENGVFWVRDLDGVRYSNKILNVPIAEFDVRHYEVYANIYENPELLEKSQHGCGDTNCGNYRGGSCNLGRTCSSSCQDFWTVE